MTLLHFTRNDPFAFHFRADRNTDCRYSSICQCDAGVQAFLRRQPHRTRKVECKDFRTQPLAPQPSLSPSCPEPDHLEACLEKGLQYGQAHPRWFGNPCALSSLSGIGCAVIIPSPAGAITTLILMPPRSPIPTNRAGAPAFVYREPGLPVCCIQTWAEADEGGIPKF